MCCDFNFIGFRLGLIVFKFYVEVVFQKIYKISKYLLIVYFVVVMYWLFRKYFSYFKLLINKIEKVKFQCFYKVYIIIRRGGR